MVRLGRMRNCLSKDGPVGKKRSPGACAWPALLASRGIVTTRRDWNARRAADLVGRNFTATRPNQLGGVDITYVPTAASVPYFAVVLGAFSRQVVG